MRKDDSKLPKLLTKNGKDVMKTMKTTMRVFTCDLQRRFVDVDAWQEDVMVSIPSNNTVLLLGVRKVVAQ